VETVGRRKWAVTDGYIPAWGNGPCPELESRDALQPTLKLPIRIQIWGLEMLWGGKRPSEFRPHARRHGAGRLAPASRQQDRALDSRTALDSEERERERESEKRPVEKDVRKDVSGRSRWGQSGSWAGI
jgi:hypothetical protein